MEILTPAAAFSFLEKDYYHIVNKTFVPYERQFEFFSLFTNDGNSLVMHSHNFLNNFFLLNMPHESANSDKHN